MGSHIDLKRPDRETILMSPDGKVYSFDNEERTLCFITTVPSLGVDSGDPPKGLIVSMALALLAILIFLIVRR